MRWMRQYPIIIPYHTYACIPPIPGYIHHHASDHTYAPMHTIPMHMMHPAHTHAYTHTYPIGPYTPTYTLSPPVYPYQHTPYMGPRPCALCIMRRGIMGGAWVGVYRPGCMSPPNDAHMHAAPSCRPYRAPGA